MTNLQFVFDVPYRNDINNNNDDDDDDDDDDDNNN